MDRYALIGNPVGHSKSPFIHTAFARTTGQDLEYTAIEAAPDGFAAAVAQFRAAGGRGINVTMPFKLQAFELATDPSERARLAGAVNAMKFEGERLYAENFDGIGLITDIQRNHGFAVRGRRVLLMGAGGAARGALQPFLEQQPAELVIANRTLAKAQQLAGQFRRLGPVRACGYGELAGERFDIVVNATSTGISGELPALPGSIFAPGALAYEMVYGRGLTAFLRLARAAGVQRLVDGVGMLVEQAAEAFTWWRGVRPDTREMIAALSAPLV